MDKFRDYIWYLLSKPFKILKKAQNQWWIWAKVMGRLVGRSKGRPSEGQRRDNNSNL